MKKSAVAILLACAAGSTGIAHAAPASTASVGYAFINASTKFAHANLHGLNLSYRYDFTDTGNGFGVMGSFTWATHSENNKNLHSKLNYYSLLAGPAYRLNDYVSFYGLVGVTSLNAKTSETEPGFSFESKATKAGFGYGAGVQFNPVQNLAVTVGYEGTNVKESASNVNFNGFIVSVGYNF